MTTIVPLTKDVLNTGKKPFNYLLQDGLTPNNTVLDIGCCVLRIGIHLINYLNKGNYFGFDKEPLAIEIAKNEIVKHNLSVKEPTIYHSLEMSVDNVNKSIDYFVAYSVFTHITDQLVEKCFKSISNVSQKGSRFYTTCHIGKQYKVFEKHKKRLVGQEYRKVEYTIDQLSNIANKYEWKLLMKTQNDFVNSKEDHYLLVFVYDN